MDFIKRNNIPLRNLLSLIIITYGIYKLSKSQFINKNIKTANSSKLNNKYILSYDCSGSECIKQSRDDKNLPDFSIYMIINKTPIELYEFKYNGIYNLNFLFKANELRLITQDAIDHSFLYFYIIENDGYSASYYPFIDFVLNMTFNNIYVSKNTKIFMAYQASYKVTDFFNPGYMSRKKYPYTINITKNILIDCYFKIQMKVPRSEVHKYI